jgi:hypothetical protein
MAMARLVKLYLILPVILFVVPLRLLKAQVDMDSCNHVNYSFSSQSTLKVLGKTNVNSFTCLNEKTLPSYVAVVCGYSTPEHMEFLETTLKIPVIEMDCGGKGINSDFREMMKADKYPYILLDLWELSLNKSQPSGLKHYTASTTITLVNTRKPVNIPVSLKKNDGNLYTIYGSISLKLSDFEITPPRPLMGLIKIDDEIVIEFVLEMHLQV